MADEPNLEATQLGLPGLPGLPGLVTRAPADQLGVTQLDVTASRAGLDATQLGWDVSVADHLTGEAPRRIGRFAVLRLLGAGGMGVVYAAYDEELDRRVAIKLLHARGGVDTSQGHTRLLREAQAMAKLSHPNIATVFEVGLWNDQVFIAMEFVAGPSVGEWLAAGPRSWQEVVQVLTQAGRGLAAAHASGLVHRDFKPDNAIVGDDGRVRVLDFGLARASGDMTTQAPKLMPAADRPPGTSSLSEPLTMTGAVLGTPAYMAPEQHLGEPADARSDQFSFCVSLYEGLYGRRPFAGDTLGELVLNVLEGKLQTPPRERRVPAKIFAVVARGLARAPEQRWPDMTTLLAALAVDPARRRRWLVGLGAATLLVGATAGALTLRANAARCNGAEAQLVGVWDDERRAQVDAALRATGLPYAEDTAARVQAGLDGYATTWAAGHRDACEATAVRQEQSETTRAERMICLAQRRQELAALVDVLARADAQTIAQAVEAVHDLPAPGVCADLNYLAAAVKPPADPVTGLQVQRFTKALAVVQAHASAGRYGEAEALLRPISGPATALGHAPLAVEVGLLRSDLLEHLGRFAEAEALAQEAYFAARVAGLESETRKAARLLTTIVGDRMARPVEGLAWALHALASQRRLPAPGEEANILRTRAVVRMHQSDLKAAAVDLKRALELDDQQATPDPLQQAAGARALGTLRREQGKFKEAEALLRRALELRSSVVGADHPSLADLHLLHGEALAGLDRDAEALAELEQALAMHTRNYGADHPWIGADLLAIGSVLQSQGDFPRAVDHLQRALVLLQRIHGADHPGVARAHNNLATALVRIDRHDEGRRHFHKALEINRARLGDSHADVARLYINLGVEHKLARDFDVAARYYARAIELLERRLGADHPTLGNLRVNVGNLRKEQGRLAEAEAEMLRGRQILEAALGPENRELANVLTVLAEVRRQRGDPVAALALAEQALALYQGGEKADPELVAETNFVVAKALTDQRRDPARARALASQAREVYAAAGKARIKELKEVDTFLARAR